MNNLNNESNNNISSLDGLRGLACLLVVFSHAGGSGLFIDIRGAGEIGVMLFFSLSGFLMAHLYGSSQWNYRTIISFGIKRFFRVYPAYFVVVISSYFILKYNHTFPYRITIEELYKHILLDGQVSVFWTIPVEMKFYLIFPFIAAIIYLIRKDKYKIYSLLILFVGILLIDLKGGKTSVWPFLEFFIRGAFTGYI